MQKNFSYPILIDTLSKAEKKFNLTADTQELQWITQVFQVENVKDFSATVCVKLEPKSSLIKVYGSVKACIEQQSIISLENFDKNYETSFEIFFDSKATYQQIREEYEDINEDAPDIVENGEIDIAAVAMEQIALIIDQYPRKDGEVFDFQSEFDEETTKNNNPFSVLQKLKK